MNLKPKGIIPAMVTPFGKDEELDADGLKKIIHFLLDSGVHGIFVSGGTGEFYALSKEEKMKIFETAVDEVDGKVPVYAGTGAESTREVLELTKIAKDAGADAAIITTPYYIKPGNHELLEHYVYIASKVDLPILVYTNPRCTGVNFDPELLLNLAEKCSNVVGIKDSTGDLTTTLNYIQTCGEKVSIMQGREPLIFATLMQGGHGSFNTWANAAPKLAVDIYDAVMKKDYGRAAKAQSEFTSLRIAYGAEANAVKEAMNMLGLPAGIARRPLLPLSQEDRKKLRKHLTNLRLL